jgi:hypothetical protein
MLTKMPHKQKENILNNIDTQIELLVLDGLVDRSLLESFFFASDTKGRLSVSQCTRLLKVVEEYSLKEAFQYPGRVSNANYAAFCDILRESSKHHRVLSWL